MHSVSDVRQTQIHTAEPLIPGPNPLKVEMAISKLKKYKSPDRDQILTEVIQVGGETLLSSIHKLINSICNREELPDQRKESIIVPIQKKGNKTDCSNYHRISLLSTSYKMLLNILLSGLRPYILRARVCVCVYVCVCVCVCVGWGKLTIQLGGKYCTTFS
jgi:hypothetical protein